MTKLKKSLIVSAIIPALAVNSAFADTPTVGEAFSNAATQAQSVVLSLLPGIALIGGAIIAVAVAVGGFGVIKRLASRI